MFSALFHPIFFFLEEMKSHCIYFFFLFFYFLVLFLDLFLFLLGIEFEVKFRAGLIINQASFMSEL